jgi:predicted ArsR family transcriptional regulator
MNSETLKDDSIKATNAIQQLYNSSVRLSDKDKALSAYLIEKSSRIASAVLIITSRSNGHDQLRTALEKSAVRLVSYAARTHESNTDRESFLLEVSSLIALLDVGVRAVRVAPKNAAVLSEELIALHLFVSELEWGEGRAFIQADHLFMRAPHELRVAEAPHMTDSAGERQTRDMRATQVSPKETYVQESQGQVQKDTEQSPIRHHIERMHDAQKDRRATILGMLQRKDRVSVRDVANVIKDCSEKTLQRELLALVAQGVLVKEGERRWSTYRLA